jgi:hypothetical protein
MEAAFGEQPGIVGSIGASGVVAVSAFTTIATNYDCAVATIAATAAIPGHLIGTDPGRSRCGDILVDIVDANGVPAGAAVSAVAIVAATIATISTVLVDYGLCMDRLLEAEG